MQIDVTLWDNGFNSTMPQGSTLSPSFGSIRVRVHIEVVNDNAPVLTFSGIEMSCVSVKSESFSSKSRRSVETINEKQRPSLARVKLYTCVC